MFLLFWSIDIIYNKATATAATTAIAVTTTEQKEKTLKYNKNAETVSNYFIFSGFA